MTRRRALIVDDDSSLSAALGEVVDRMAGYDVTVSGGGEEAISILDQAPDAFDVVISDATMQGMSGKALAGVMAERWPDVPVVLMSGVAPSLSLILPGETGVSSVGGQRLVWLYKPFSSTRLIEVLRQVTGSGS